MATRRLLLVLALLAGTALVGGGEESHARPTAVGAPAVASSAVTVGPIGGSMHDQEMLVILDQASAGSVARDIDLRVHVVHRMPHVLVVQGDEHQHAEVAAIPGVVQALERDAAGAALAGLSEGERLFVKGWLARPAKQPPDDGRDWDAPGYIPPR